MKRFLANIFLAAALLIAPIFSTSALAQNPQQQNSKGDITATSASCTLVNTTGCVVLPLPNSNRISAAITVTGTFTGTLNFIGTNAGIPFSTPMAVAPSAGGPTVTSTTGTGTWLAPSIGGLTVIGVDASAMTGTATITITSSTVRGGTAASTGSIICSTVGGLLYENGVVNNATCDSGLTYAGLGGNVILVPISGKGFSLAPAANGSAVLDWLGLDGNYGLETSDSTGKKANWEFTAANHSIGTGNEGGLGAAGWSVNTQTGENCVTGSTSGKACWIPAAVQGTPNDMVPPTTTGTNGQFLQTDGGNPQQLSWASAAAISIAAGQESYGSGTNSVTGDPQVLYVQAFAGADLGAKINACTAALPTAKGRCVVSNFVGTQTLSTAVTVPANVTLEIRSHIAITQTAAITLSGANSALLCSPDQTATFTKGASLDQITISAARVAVIGCSLAGVKGSFTGNGIVTATGATQALIANNNISAEAGDDIKDNSGTYTVNIIRSNVLLSWGTHAFENTSNSQQSIFIDNYMLGDGTSTGAAILNAGSAAIIGNFVKDSNAVVLVDDSTAAQGHGVVGNQFNQTNGWPALKVGAKSSVGQNDISGGGANGPAVQVVACVSFTGNNVVVTNADGIDVSNSPCVFTENTVGVTINNAGNRYDIQFSGDQIGNKTIENLLTISDTANLANTDACIHNNPSGTHNLDILFEGDHCIGQDSGSVTVYGLFTDNSNNLSTNWSQTARDLSCVHITTCVKRTDTQNQISAYIDVQRGDTTLDAGTGSTNDVWVWDNYTVTFATLPTPIGNGSHGYCTDCTQAKPTASGGTGALAYREAGAWNGL